MTPSQEVRTRKAAKAAISGGRVWAFMAIALGLLVSSAAEAGSPLSLGLKIHSEIYKPMVAVSRGFKTCFKTDASGATVLGICTDTQPPTPAQPGAPAPEGQTAVVTPAAQPSRAPASAPAGDMLPTKR